MLSAFVFLVSLAVAMVPMPEAGRTPENPVSFELVRDLALRRAEAEWPGCRPGPVIPYVDVWGANTAYMFHFRTDGEEFPEFEQVRADVWEEARALGHGADVSSWRSKYAYVLVSCRYDQAPVLTFGYGTSDYFAVGAEAMARAEEGLGHSVTGLRVYFVTPCTFFEFTSVDGRQTVVSSLFDRTWESRAEFAREFTDRRQELVAQYGFDASQALAIHRAEWERVLNHGFTDNTEAYVPNKERAPYYDWSYGCTPSAAAMVMGYIDRTQDYGRIVDWFWSRHDMVEGEMDWQTPNVQRECALAMRTDTTRGATQIMWVSPGLIEVAADNGYDFTTVRDQGGSHNDWAWSTIVQEIDGGYAHVWSALWSIHSLACYGYRTTDKYVYVHNTWWKPAAWWAHSGNDWSYVDSPHPSGGDARRIELTHPLGDTFYNSIGRGEVFQVGETTQVTWTNFGHPGTKVDIEMSTDCGRNWQAVAGDLPDNGSCDWFIPASVAACDSVRLRVKQYGGTTLTSADGTYGCFRLIREPLAPRSTAPPNGQQILTPPVVLVIDTPPPAVDSIEFRLVFGGDTIWIQRGVELTCPLPDTIFTYGRSYKWVTRARNQFGWGQYGTPWSFWIRFQPGVEEAADCEFRIVSSSSVCRRSPSGIRFEVGPAQAEARILVYDALGEVVRQLEPGERSWDYMDGTGKRVQTGLYFARLVSASGTETRKFVLLD